MKKSLADYAAENPAPEPITEKAAAADAASQYRRKQEKLEQAEDMKASIAQQIEGGNALEYILYTAVRAIGLLTDDPGWTKQQTDILELVYGDLAQESLVYDNAAIALDRLQNMRKDYCKRNYQRLKNLKDYTALLNTCLTEAEQYIRALYPEEELMKDAGAEWVNRKFVTVPAAEKKTK